MGLAGREIIFFTAARMALFYTGDQSCVDNTDVSATAELCMCGVKAFVTAAAPQ